MGYNRSYVYLGKEFSYENWMAAQKAGRNFVTNGPMLLVTVNANLPGAVLARDVGQARVEIDAFSAADLDRAEILVDGVVARTLRGWVEAEMERVRAVPGNKL